MENDGFFMNVNTNVNTSTLKKSNAGSKKMEKKNKYAEKKLLNKKRIRDPTKESANNNNSLENKLGENTNITNANPNYQKKNFLDYNNQNSNLNNNRFENTEAAVNNEEKGSGSNNNNFNQNKKSFENKNSFKKEFSNKFNKNNKKNETNTKENTINTNNIKSEIEKSTELNLNLTEENPTTSNSNNTNNLSNNLNYKNKEEPNDELIDELNEFYEKQDATKTQRLTTLDRQKNKQKIKTMQSEIETEIKELTTEAALNEELKQKSAETPIDYNASVFSLKEFNDLEISPYLKRVLKKENFSVMTKIQKKSIPILLKHRDVVVKSETGSGKTLAYVVPVYDFLINLNLKNKIQRKDGVYVVVFAPTHELCLQIESTFDKLKSCCINAVFGSLMGGQSMETEKSRLRKGLNIIVTTPGRMLYHLTNTSTLLFSNLKMFVFDEADILLNMGFEKDIKECMRLIFNKYNTSVPENMCVKIESKNKKKQNSNLNGGYGIEEEEVICKEVEKSEDLNFEHFKKFKIFLISATIDNKIRKMADFLMKGFKTVGFEMKKDQDKTKNNKENNKENKENNSKNNNNKDEDQKMMEIIEEEDNENYSIPTTLVQEYSVVFDEFRLIHLICQIYNNSNKKIMLFVSCCDTVNFLQEFLSNFEFNLEHLINEGEVGVGFNKYKNRDDANNKSNNNNNKKSFNNKNDKFGKSSSNSSNKDSGKDADGGNNKDNSDPTKKLKIVNSPILKLHGKMTHEERKKIFKEFNQDKPGNLEFFNILNY